MIIKEKISWWTHWYLLRERKLCPRELCFSGKVMGMDVLETRAARWSTKMGNLVRAGLWQRKHSTGNKAGTVAVLEEHIVWKWRMPTWKWQVTLGLQRDNTGASRNTLERCLTWRVRAAWDGGEDYASGGPGRGQSVASLHCRAPLCYPLKAGREAPPGDCGLKANALNLKPDQF